MTGTQGAVGRKQGPEWGHRDSARQTVVRGNAGGEDVHSYVHMLLPQSARSGQVS